MNNNTAILVFANSAREELKHKAIVQGESLFKGLNKAVRKTVLKTGLPYIIITEDKQVGDTFGQRLSNAMQSVYKMGYDNVIAIGNDTPQLKASHLLKTAEELQHTKAVLGPTFDGGFYLLGLHKSAFQIETFYSLKWQTKSLTGQLLKHFDSQQILTKLLSVFFDIDDVFGLKAVVKFSTTITKKLLHLIAEILATPAKAFSKLLQFFTTNDEPVYFNKGSPQLVR